MFFVKTKEGIDTDPLQYSVTLTDQKGEVKVYSIELRYQRKTGDYITQNGVIVDIIINDKVEVFWEFKSKMQVKALWNLQCNKISEQISNTALFTLVTIHFPTNWLLLLPD